MATLTTPDPIELNGIFRDMADSGVEFVAMEASAHALALKKLDGISFSSVGFTNFTRDHLDYFGDMEAYGRAKASLFSKERSGHLAQSRQIPYNKGKVRKRRERS